MATDARGHGRSTWDGRPRPAAVVCVLFFGCNVDASGMLPFEFTPVAGRCLQRHRLAATLPNAKLVRLDGVSHFAPVQRPELFDRVVATFVAGCTG